ncbi:MAG: hypothetical protein GY753_02430 [Gammaproteobacteria bacterium]|nr:hypothetical protein [Gammaproteobacteria bacterium]
MDTKYIGTGQVHETIAEWADYVKTHDPLTEDMTGILTDDKIYDWGADTDLNFIGIDKAGFEVILDVEESVRHDGDFGNGARIEADPGGNYSKLYDARGVTIKNLSIVSTRVGAAARPFDLSSVKGENVIAKGHATSAYGAFRVLGNNCELIACRGVSELTAGISAAHTTAADLVLTSCTFEGAIGVDMATTTHTGEMINVNTSGCAVGFAGTYSGTYSNNASDDGMHPGPDGVTVTADPYEADGYTPSQAGELTAAGIYTGVTHGADGKPFALIPAIGAYPAYLPFDGVAPILINPTSEGDTTGLLCKVDTNEANGILFTVATDTATKPEPEQVEAGQDHLGASANDSQFGAVTATGSQSLVMNNVDVGSTQHVHFMHKDAAGNYSLVVTAAAIVVPEYYAQEIYDGMVIPPDSILHLYDGTHTGADASATLTTALDLTLDAVAGRVCKNTADGSEGIITGNTAGPNSVVTVTLAGGTDNLFDTGDTYEIQIDADNPDVIWYERATTFAGDSTSFSWYLEDVSEGQSSPEYTAIYNLPGQPDGEYNITITVKGVVSFDLVSVSSESGNRMDNTLSATGGPTINDGLADWLSKAGNENINDATRRWLIAQGATPAPLSDMWLEFLRGLGYTGTVSDMKASFWRNGGA